MATKKLKTKKISLDMTKGALSAIFERFRSPDSKSDISLLRSVLNPEKARILHTIKSKQPNSLYELAKLLSRDFKSVRQDVFILQRLGFVEMIPIHKGKREKLKPLLVADSLEIKINI